MNLSTIVIVITMAMLAIGCGKKADEETAKKQPSAVAGTAAKNTEPAGSDARQSSPVAVITSVHAQWIISDSMPKAEITLSGENLAPDATVTSNSPQMQVEKVEPDPIRTQVIVAMSMASPAGDYELQYQAPGQDPISFTIRYAGMK